MTKQAENVEGNVPRMVGLPTLFGVSAVLLVIMVAIGECGVTIDFGYRAVDIGEKASWMMVR